MAVSVDELWTRLEKMEREMKEMRETLKELAQPKPVMWEAWEASRRERVGRETEEVHSVVDALFERWGIPPDLKPIPAEQLQQMMMEGGMKPEDNVLSRAIIEMREE